MRLDKLWIKQFKNLQGVEIDFSEGDWVTVVIGWNGTGKSNVLESLVILFRDLELEKAKPAFAYKLEYRCRKQRIRIDADPERSDSPYIIHVVPEGNEPVKGSQSSLLESETPASEGWQSISYAKFRENKTQYLPSYVFGYYSGPSNRLEKHFDDHQRRFYTELIKSKPNSKQLPLRPLFYARPVHSQFVLLAFMLRQDKTVRQFLFDYMGLDPKEGVDSVLFVMHKPSWAKARDSDLFWSARGTVRSFLSRLFKIALAPIRLSRRVSIDFRRYKTVEQLYLFVRDTDSLRELVGELQASEFFKELESTYISELISEVRIRVKLRRSDGAVEFRELSEGEQQLLSVLGLLRFTAEDESLFLLDEPDTHLNPSWAVDYLNFLEKFVGTNTTTRESSHVLLATHNPLAISNLVKQQVQILSRGTEGRVAITTPELDPRGMGFAGILTSEMFGLESTLDPTTEQLLERQRELVGKEEKLSSQEKKDLEEVNGKLEQLGFRFEMRDRVYTKYLKLRQQVIEQFKLDKKASKPIERNPAAEKLLLEAVSRAKQEAEQQGQ